MKGASLHFLEMRPLFTQFEGWRRKEREYEGHRADNGSLAETESNCCWKTCPEKHNSRLYYILCLSATSHLETYIFCFEHEYCGCINFHWKLFTLFLVTNIFIYLIGHYIKIPNSWPREKTLHPTAAEHTFFSCSHRTFTSIDQVLGH